MWFIDGLDAIDTGGIGTFGAGVWNIVGVGDLDGDGKTDIVWHNTETGLLYYWLMDGRSQLGAGGIGIVDNFDWRTTAVGDMNGYGSPDILWENTANGRRLVWFMDGVDNVGQEFLAEQPDPAWSRNYFHTKKLPQLPGTINSPGLDLRFRPRVVKVLLVRNNISRFDNFAKRLN